MATLKSFVHDLIKEIIWVGMPHPWEAFKARLDGALSNLLLWKVSLPMGGGTGTR